MTFDLCLLTYAFVFILALLPGGAYASAAAPGGAARSPLGQAQAGAVLEGHVEVLVEDSQAGSRTLYILISEDRRIPLRFLVDSPNLTTGTRIRVYGRYETDGTFSVSALERLPEG